MILALLLAAAVQAAPQKPDRMHALSSYAFDARVPAAERVKRVPDWVLAHWSKADGAPEYAAYEPTPAQKRRLAEAIGALPEEVRRVLEERLIEITFISRLKGNGITNWALDEKGRTFVHVILAAESLEKPLSLALSERESSPFKGGAAVAVDAGPGGEAVYAVAHELFHAYDYVRGVTPYTESHHAAAVGKSGKGGWDVWKGYTEAKPEAHYPARALLRFYGFKPPLLPDSEAASVCGQLAGSPFPSLYGSMNWADDAAELFVYRHLVERLGRPYRYVCGGKTFDRAADAALRARARSLVP